MPYQAARDLPINLREILPAHAQEIFLKSFNGAWQEYQDASKRPQDISQEEIAYRAAWSTVKRKYAKNKRTGKWEPKS
jgi:cation transport regulator